MARGHRRTYTDEQIQAELNKCNIVCLWHHHLHTAAQLGHRGIEELQRDSFKWPNPAHDQLVLAKIKEYLGCCHPQHAASPWAGVADTDHPQYHTFLERSEYVRGYGQTASGGRVGPPRKARRHLDHLKRALATIHCSCCHAAYTAKENALLVPVPGTEARAALLAQHAPAFSKSYDEDPRILEFTAKGGWEKERERIREARAANIAAKGAESGEEEDGEDEVLLAEFDEAQEDEQPEAAAAADMLVDDEAGTQQDAPALPCQQCDRSDPRFQPAANFNWRPVCERCVSAAAAAPPPVERAHG
jgi:hypothetical protein